MGAFDYTHFRNLLDKQGKEVATKYYRDCFSEGNVDETLLARIHVISCLERDYNLLGMSLNGMDSMVPSISEGSDPAYGPSIVDFVVEATCNIVALLKRADEIPFAKPCLDFP